MTPPKSDTPTEEPTFVQKTVKVITWPVAAVAGTAFAHKYARNATYDALDKPTKDKETGVEKPGAFHEIKAKRDAKIERIKAAAVEHEVNILKADGTKHPKVPKIAGQIRAVNREYEREAGKIMEASGYKYTHHFIKDLGDIQRIETGLAFLAPAAVAVTVGLTIADSKVLEKLTRHTPKDVEAQR